MELERVAEEDGPLDESRQAVVPLSAVRLDGKPLGPDHRLHLAVRARLSLRRAQRALAHLQHALPGGARFASPESKFETPRKSATNSVCGSS